MPGYNHGAGGRPPHERDEQIAAKVKMLSAMLGATSTEIGLIVGLSGPTVMKYYRYEYEVGTLEAAANVAQSLYRAATQKDKPNVIAAIFFLKCRAGWREDAEGPGKKETAELLSRVADQNTGWEGLLDAPVVADNNNEKPAGDQRDKPNKPKPKK